MDLKDLSAPFRSEEINWKPQTISHEGDRALAVPYIDARDVAERLDQVVGPGCWQVDHKQVGDQTLTGVGILIDGAWIWKWDMGMVDREGDEAMSAKGSLSDGLKRAAVLWGIGRYLYRLPKSWVGYDKTKKRLTETPALPSWALPAGAKPQKHTPVDESTPAKLTSGNAGKKPDAPAATSEPAGHITRETEYWAAVKKAGLGIQAGKDILKELKGNFDEAYRVVMDQHMGNDPAEELPLGGATGTEELPF